VVVLEFALRVSLRGWKWGAEAFPFSSDVNANVNVFIFILIHLSDLSAAHSWIWELRCSKFDCNKMVPGVPVPVPVVLLVPSPFCWKFERLLP